MAALPIVLDTDIGTDVDDLLALSLALASPELEIAAISCVHGDVAVRAGIVRRVLELAGGPRPPIGLGLREPLLRSRPVYWPGHEGEGIVDAAAAARDAAGLPDAVELILELTRQRPGEITLVPIGPLTNLAAAVIRDPGVVGRVRRVVMMGGVARVVNATHLPWVEHNIGLDPEAAHVVFSAGWPIVMVGADVTYQVALHQDELARIEATGGPLHRLLAEQVGRYPHFRSRGWTLLHDPLAVATVFRPGLVELAPMRVDVELHGRHTTGATVARPPRGEPANVDVAIAVDAGPFVELFLQRICGAFGTNVGLG